MGISDRFEEGSEKAKEYGQEGMDKAKDTGQETMRKAKKDRERGGENPEDETRRRDQGYQDRLDDEADDWGNQ